LNYNQTLEYLYQKLPMYQRIGAAAYKKDLDNTLALSAFLNNPHTKFKSVHVAGTNGKGSVTHGIAAILQAAGYKTGVYVSPHYRDFRERIKINGQYIPKKAVINFVKKCQPVLEDINPSFFEATVCMAFDYFARMAIDVAVVEVGLGGRLDSTNIIHPELAVITNISLDHTDMLGDTLPLIAAEKAGIIKAQTPVVIGETNPQTAPVFIQKAANMAAPIFFADQILEIKNFEQNLLGCKANIENSGQLIYPDLSTDLTGDFQRHNLLSILQSVETLKQQGFIIPKEAIYAGLNQVKPLTNFIGRWHVLQQHPLAIADSGHNEAGIKFVATQLQALNAQKLHLVIGFSKDKSIDAILQLLPTKNTVYYFCKANIPKGLSQDELQATAARFGLHGQTYPSVKAAYKAALKAANPLHDAVFVGGSIFVVGEVI
jgi:dihydrofolate synthase/folylpolyglutamate synthase